ncbi:MAG: hypothetical protein ACLUR5_12550 [Eubacterium ventriosum]
MELCLLQLSLYKKVQSRLDKVTVKYIERIFDCSPMDQSYHITGTGSCKI